MERHLKERLIGAAVLVAAAVILIPEMLSGRRDPSNEGAATVVPAGDAPLKTYTIDLNRAPAQSSGIEEPATTAPPPEAAPAREEPATSAPPQEIPESGPADSVQGPVHPPEGDRPAVAAVVPAPPPVSAPIQQAPITSQTQPEVAKPAGGWAVQLGSFSSQAKAQGMVNELRDGGYDAFVMPVRSGSNTLYRVRIGPVANRDAAVGVQNKVKSKVPAATVVKHP